MMKLIVGGHAIKKGRERIPLLDELSAKGIERWYQKNVLYAKKVPLGSDLYFRLENTYNRRCKQKIIYLKDGFGIYIIEQIDEFRGFLHSVQELNFREELRVKLKTCIKDKQLAELIGLRDYLP